MMTFEQAIGAAAGIVATGIGGWAIRTLYSTAQLVAVIQARVAEHDDKHETHDERGIDHERRISRIEGGRPSRT